MAEGDRVEFDDGTFSYASATKYDGPTTRREGALELRFIGAAVYASPPNGETLTEAAYDDGSADSEEDPISSLIGSVVQDEDGLAWEVIGIDEESLSARVAAYDAMINADESEGADLLRSGEWSSTDYHDRAMGQDEAPAWHEDEGYTNYNCSGVAKNVWDDGDENVIFTSELDTYVTAPLVTVTWGSTRCSGTLFDDDHVLLAAHCVVDKSTDTEAAPEDVQVCQHDAYSSSDCAGVEVVNAYGSYFPLHQAKHDWAVLRIDENLGGSNQYMGLSAASDTTIEGITEHRLGGIPGIAEGDESSCTTTNTRIHLALDGELDNLYNKSMRLDLTHGSGYSGGAYYYDGATPGGRRYVIGVHSGTSINVLLNRAAKGPKVPYYRSSILAMP